MRKGEQTRQHIIRKAAAVLNHAGTREQYCDLMKATGFEKGRIYRHFESKQQLATEAFDYVWKLAVGTRFCGLPTLGPWSKKGSGKARSARISIRRNWPL